MNKGMPIDEVAALSSTAKERALPAAASTDYRQPTPRNHMMKKNDDKPAARRVKKPRAGSKRVTSKPVDIETILRALYEVGLDESEKATNSGLENPPAMTRAKVDAKIRKLLRKRDKS
jgi:hypothetical protein